MPHHPHETTPLPLTPEAVAKKLRELEERIAALERKQHDGDLRTTPKDHATHLLGDEALRVELGHVPA